MTNPIRPQIIFLGNGLLADYAKAELADHCDIIFHARTKDDLATVVELRRANPAAHAILASFGVLIPQPLLDLFEPEGIINIHPSSLPRYRGASPIESAILAGDTTLGLSVMKLAQKMDAGPLYYQTSLDFSALLDPTQTAGQALTNFYVKYPALTHPSPETAAFFVTLDPAHPAFPLADAAAIKQTIYCALATTGATWLAQHLNNLPTPIPQPDHGATFCTKFDKSMSQILPDATETAKGHLETATKTAAQLHREIIAYAIYPRSKIALGGHETLILASHIANPPEAPLLSITASDGRILSLDRIQPAGKNPMDPKSFQNGYLK